MKKILFITLLVSAFSFADMEKVNKALAEYQAQKNMIASVQTKADALINSLVELVNEKDKEIKELKSKLEEK